MLKFVNGYSAANGSRIDQRNGQRRSPKVAFGDVDHCYADMSRNDNREQASSRDLSSPEDYLPGSVDSQGIEDRESHQVPGGGLKMSKLKNDKHGQMTVRKSMSDNQICQSVTNGKTPSGRRAVDSVHYGIRDKDYASYNVGYRDEEDGHLPRGYRNECYLASQVCESTYYRQESQSGPTQSPADRSSTRPVVGYSDYCLYSDHEFLARYALARERSLRQMEPPPPPCGADMDYVSTSDSSDDVASNRARPIRRSHSGHVISHTRTYSDTMQRSKSGQFDCRSSVENCDITLRTGKRPNYLGPFNQTFRDLPEDHRMQNLQSKQSGPSELEVRRRHVDSKGTKNGIRPISIHGTNVQWESKLKELVELLTRTSLETHKLDLMAEISSLKIKLASADKDRRDLDDRLRIAQRQIKELESRLAVRDAEITELRQRLVRNGTVVTPDSNEYEVEKLKKAVDALMFSNQEKDKRIDELRKLLRRYKKIEEMVVQAQGRKALDDMMINAEDDTSSTSSTTPSLGENAQKDQQYDESKPDRSFPSATSTPVHSLPENGFGTGTSTVLSSTPKRPQIQRSSSAEDLNKKQNVNNNNHREGSYRESGGSHNFGTFVSDNHEVRRSRGFPALGKALLRVKTGKRSTSAPNLAHTEVVTDDEDGLQHTAARPPDIKKKKGIRGLFGKLKRSGSQDFHEREREQFRRGGVRATASARLGWSKDSRVNDDTPFSRWDCERVTQWMNDIGLNMYLLECRRWVKNGDHLIRASPHELEKELGVKNSLHRKKLQLALQSVSSMEKVTKQELDHNWVTRWLDDVGLPQYKDNFYDARVDGRMLQYLTVEDLLALKVTNELHHISIKRGIQVLHVHGFNPQCLRRRPSPEEGQLQNIPADVALWTNHRVMEWLKTIDLAEYAPNLRGSGVHGALMVLETRFNAELFAQLLSIPQNKTLLRRHLSTHFVALIGNETQHKKREQESLPSYVPLLPNSKVKGKKFGIFGHKRNKSDADMEDFICPDFTRRGLTNGGPLDKEKDEKAAKEIGAFSKEINSLTDMLAKDKFFDSVPTSNV